MKFLVFGYSAKEAIESDRDLGFEYPLLLLSRRHDSSIVAKTPR